jgi:hypothetical protein
MNNWDFVVWMLAFPALNDLVEVVKYKWGKPTQCRSDLAGAVALVGLSIWFGVGALLY